MEIYVQMRMMEEKEKLMGISQNLTSQ